MNIHSLGEMVLFSSRPLLGSCKIEGINACKFAGMIKEAATSSQPEVSGTEMWKDSRSSKVMLYGMVGPGSRREPQLKPGIVRLLSTSLLWPGSPLAPTSILESRMLIVSAARAASFEVDRLRVQTALARWSARQISSSLSMLRPLWSKEHRIIAAVRNW